MAVKIEHNKEISWTVFNKPRSTKGWTEFSQHRRWSWICLFRWLLCNSDSVITSLTSLSKRECYMVRRHNTRYKHVAKTIQCTSLCLLFTDLKTEKGPHWLNITKWTVIAEAPIQPENPSHHAKHSLAAVCVLIFPRAWLPDAADMSVMMRGARAGGVW